MSDKDLVIKIDDYTLSADITDDLTLVQLAIVGNGVVTLIDELTDRGEANEST